MSDNPPKVRDAAGVTEPTDWLDKFRNNFINSLNPGTFSPEEILLLGPVLKDYTAKLRGELEYHTRDIVPCVNHIREIVYQSMQAGMLGVLAAKTRLPEGALRDFVAKAGGLDTFKVTELMRIDSNR